MGLELSIWPVTITNADTALHRERERERGRTLEITMVTAKEDTVQRTNCTVLFHLLSNSYTY